MKPDPWCGAQHRLCRAHIDTKAAASAETGIDFCEPRGWSDEMGNTRSAHETDQREPGVGSGNRKKGRGRCVSPLQALMLHPDKDCFLVDVLFTEEK